MNSSKTYKICAVVPRFSTMIRGGAEKHAYDVLSIFPTNCEITILTSTALDYISWKNYFKPGISRFERFKIERFQNVKTRNIKKFNQISQKLYDKFPNQSSEEEQEWLESQGPYCPDLINRIEETQAETDLFIFFSYLYYPILNGLKLVPDKSIFVPMFHDEFPINLMQYKQVYNDKILYAFNTPEEKNLFERVFEFKPRKQTIIGTYIKPINHDENLTKTQSQKEEKETKILLTIGRMDLGKGIYELVQNFQKWNDTGNRNCELHLIGANPPKLVSKFASKSIRFLGALSESDKYHEIRNADILINPSSVESFSIVVMEAWSQKTPILVNANSEVLVGHCKRSNGGLWYADFESFVGTLNFMLNNHEICTQMGNNGRKYVEANFSQDVIREKWKNLLDINLS
ncbi:MAG: glycosyltransferase family 4 protein [Leptospiraceae bacterium]|nr:glycosyltransferase family 4 protein [Leptospiraceae bacterium]